MFISVLVDEGVAVEIVSEAEKGTKIESAQDLVRLVASTEIEIELIRTNRIKAKMIRCFECHISL